MSRIIRRTIVVTGIAGVAAPWVARAAEPEFKLEFGNIGGPPPQHEAWSLLGSTAGKLG